MTDAHNQYQEYVSEVRAGKQTDAPKTAPQLHDTAQARRFYHHVLHDGHLTPYDVGLMVSAIERRDTKIAALVETLREILDDPCMDPEGNSEIARAALTKVKESK